MQLRDLLESLQARETRKQELAGEESEHGTESLSLVTFRIGKREYAIDIDEASEIIRVSKVSVVPNSPAWIRGVCNLRGDLVPLVDLSHRFQNSEHPEITEPPGALKGRTAIVVRLGETVFGLIIDEMKKTLSVPVESVSASPHLLQSLGREFVRGVVRRPENEGAGLLLILNLDAVSQIAD